MSKDKNKTEVRDASELMRLLGTREIKFRRLREYTGLNSVTGKKSEIYDEGKIGKKDWVLLKAGTFHGGGEGWEWDSPFLQFTGLKDKNGKEIYEGDILHIDLKEYSGFEDDSPFLVGRNFHSDICYLRNIDNYDDGEYIEVIGSIFENENLLDNG